MEYARDLEISVEAPGVAAVQDVRRQREGVRRRYRSNADRWNQVVLATAPPWETASPPIGLGYLAEALLQAGRSCRVVDGNGLLFKETESRLRALWRDEHRRYWSRSELFGEVENLLAPSLDRLADEITAGRPLLVGFWIAACQERCTAALVRRVLERRPGLPVLLGGPACLEPERRSMLGELVAHAFTGFVVGEGETPLVELVDRLAAGMDLDGAPGFVPYDNPDSEVLLAPTDLREISFPRYERFCLDLYDREWLDVQWSRGSSRIGAFHGKDQTHSVFRHRNPDDVVAELDWFSRRGISSFHVCDSEINGNIRFLRRVCEMILDRGLQVRWRGRAIPHRAMTSHMLELMKRAGCTDLHYALQTGSQRMLEIINGGRPFTVAEAESVIRATHGADITVSLSLLAGFPGETEEDFDLTLDFIRRNSEWIESIRSLSSFELLESGDLAPRSADRGIVLAGGSGNGGKLSQETTLARDVCRERVERVLVLARSLSIPVLDQNMETDSQPLDLSPQRHRSHELPVVDDAPWLPAEVCNTIEAERQPRDQTSSSPQTVEIELSAACNLRCVGCWCHSPLLSDDRHHRLQRSKPLPTQRLVELLDELASLGVESIQFSGSGEPLVNTEAVKIIAHASSLGLRTTLVTNGTLIDVAMAEALGEAGVNQVTVSLWAGDAATYALTHPGAARGTFARVTEGLRALAAVRDRLQRPVIKVYHVVSKANFNTIESMIEHALSVDADQVELQAIDLLPDTAEDLALTPEEVLATEAAFKRLKARPDYTDYWLGTPPLGPDAPDMVREEFMEFGRFVRVNNLEGFSAATGQQLRCPRGFVSCRVTSPAHGVFGFVFAEELCNHCPRRTSCFADRPPGRLVVPTLELTGTGSFLRRIRAATCNPNAAEADIIRDLPCVVGDLYSRIDYQGNVVACCKGSSAPLGNVANEPFAAIWKSPRYEEFRRNARTLAKDDPFFAPYGCLQSCDNLGMNLQALYALTGKSPTQEDTP